VGLVVGRVDPNRNSLYATHPLFLMLLRAVPPKTAKMFMTCAKMGGSPEAVLCLVASLRSFGIFIFDH